MIHQLIYYSKNTVEPGTKKLLAALRDILGAAQRNNSANMVTGYLIFDKNWFVQILEGEKSVVHQTYEKIAQDSRHADSKILVQRDIAVRQFGDWSMGGAMRLEDVEEIFIRNGITGDLDPGRLTAAIVTNLCLELAARERGNAHSS